MGDAAAEASGRLSKIGARFNHGMGKRGDYWDFIWIVYSIFFFVEPIERHNQQYWLEFAAFYTVFLAIYAAIIFARHRWQSYLALIAMAVLGAIYYPHNNGCLGTFVYAAAFLPFISESLTVCLGGFALLSALLIGEGIRLHTSPWAWGIGALFTFIVGGTNLFMAQRLRANCKLEMAHEEIEQLAKVAERERIARDLHDVLGHTLSVVVLKSELAGRLMDRDPGRAGDEIREVEQISRQALSDVRDAIRGYRSQGLAAELTRAKSTLETAGLTVQCDAATNMKLPAVQESVLSLAVREAVTNVVRHARAHHCRMRLEQRNGSCRL